MSRDILAPPLQRMSGQRSYRINSMNENFGGNHRRQESAKNNYVEQNLYGDDDDEADESNGDFTVEELDGGSFKLTMTVASAFHGGIIGQRGATKRNLETETGTSILIPPRDPISGTSKSEEIIIKGKSRSNVCSAYRKICLLIQSSRERIRPTHFVSVVLSSEEVKQNYANFMNEVLNCNYPSIQPDFFQNTNALHQTLVVCCLLNDAERAKGVEVLQTCREFLEKIKTPLKIKISGLEIMNDDPSAVRILYAKIESDDLQQLGNMVTKRFKDSGLSTEKHNRDTVKLHMTLLKSPHTVGKPITFDARDLLKKFGDYDFGYAECSELQLCAMHGEGESEEEYYKITGSMKFN